MPILQRKNVPGLAGGAGLIRYFDVDEGGPKVDPKIVLAIVFTFILIEILFSIFV